MILIKSWSKVPVSEHRSSRYFRFGCRNGCIFPIRQPSSKIVTDCNTLVCDYYMNWKYNVHWILFCGQIGDIKPLSRFHPCKINRCGVKTVSDCHSKIEVFPSHVNEWFRTPYFLAPCFLSSSTISVRLLFFAESIGVRPFPFLAFPSAPLSIKSNTISL